MKKAITLLEGVRAAWKDPKKNMSPDASVLLNLARLYETDSPEKALHCLQLVEQLELDQIPQAERPTGTEGEAEVKAAMRESLPPQLLNIIGCFYSQAEKHEQASEMFEAALKACMKIGGKDQGTNTFVWIVSGIDYLDRPFFKKGTVTLIR